MAQPQTALPPSAQHRRRPDARNPAAVTCVALVRAARHPRAPPKPIDLTIPLAALLGPRTRPGESHGFGPLDPALCRALAALAAASPHTTACVTVTDPNGHAIGHGCLTTGRRKAQLPGAPDPPLTALPAHLNLTITATRLTQLLHHRHPAHPGNHARPGSHARPAPHRRTGWALTPPAAPDQHARHRAAPDQHDPPRRPALVPDLDHHPAQRPAVRRPARARPHPRLRPPPRIARLRAQRRPPPPGPDPRPRVHAADLLPPRQRVRLRARRPLRPRRTDAARATPEQAPAPATRSSKSPGWKVTQPKPGWHQWQTPSGRTYTQEPKRYPT